MAKENKNGKGKGQAKGQTKGQTKGQAKTQAAEQAGPAAKVRQFRDFLEKAKIELKKVTWPARKETVATSVAVLVLTFVMALFLGLADVVLSKIVQAILS
ncbi:preprotein translocase subunit SecE [Desulfohalovibrio reitneri]|uniref:preprotein translocase subunit SecE n=1 Tax=Desulfohalovibrio reitneri TaxID=1307759 RepID=UPI0004A72EC3|nr:preprotein translocase subunit SecE [Desulfohalovibrio reitneri]